MVDFIVLVSAGAFFIWSMCMISAFGEIMIAKISKVIKRVIERNGGEING